MKQHPLRWLDGPKSYHLRLKNEPDCFCLYSGKSSSLDRFSYIGINPIVCLTLYPNFFDIYYLDSLSYPSFSGKKERLFCNPFDWLEKRIQIDLDYKSFPFFGPGWLVALDYEAALLLDKTLPSRKLTQNHPLGFFKLYDPLLVFDHFEKKAFAVSYGLGPDLKEDATRADRQIKNLIEKLKAYKNLEKNLFPDFETKTILENAAFLSNFTEKEYEEAVRLILEQIARGDVYQVNLSQQFVSKNHDFFRNVTKDFFVECFWDLAKRHPAAFSAFIGSQEEWILSLSPEEMFFFDRENIRSSPIKGTRPRVKNASKDREICFELFNSTKENAELLMITDLVRNDLGKICRPGSVKVPDFKRVESLDYAHHLVSTVQGKIEKGRDSLSILKALFPGGSISGAPKRKAIEVIRNLEPGPRGIYTGSIGWIDFKGPSRFNIAIRTMEKRLDRIYFGTGGGIVADSDPTKEYEETLVKARVWK